MNKLEQIIDNMLKSPHKWSSKWMRRIFVLTIPISFPLWLLWIASIVMFIILFLMIATPITYLVETWQGEDE